jgi:hypothetical protein
MPLLPRAGESNPNPAALLPSKYNYIEVALVGIGADHPHLVFTDPSGRRTGYVGGRLVQQVPGITVVQNFSVQNWNSSREPTFHLPLGHPVYEVTVDGSALKSALKTKLTINGAGVVWYINDIRMVPGQQDTMLLPTDDLGITYASRARFPGTPTIGAQFPQFDIAAARQNQLRARLITIGFGALGYAPGSPFTIRLIPSAGAAQIGSPGQAVPLVKSATFVLSLDSTPLNGGEREHSYFTGSLRFNPRTHLAQFPYLNPRGPTLPVDIVDASGKRVGRQYTPPH